MRAPIDDDAGLRAAYRAHGAGVYRFALRALRDRGQAEEAVQETFLRAWQGRDRYDPLLGSLQTWIFAIARNIVSDMARRRASRPHIAGELHDSVAVCEDHAEGVLRSFQVENALARISHEHRQVIEQVYFEERSPGEVAAELGVPDGTVRSRLYYGLRALGVALAETGYADAV